MSEFTFLSEEVVHAGSVTVARGNFKDPTGAEFQREYIRSTGAVSMVPLLDDNETVLLVRQFRTAVNAYLMELPAGKRDVPGEAPEQTARRELIEEVGKSAGSLELLCEFYNSPGTSNQTHHVYLARDLSDAQASAQSIEESHMTIERINLRDVEQLIASRTIVDAKTIVGLFMTRSRLGL